jgi:hypothetical protein
MDIFANSIVHFSDCARMICSWCYVLLPSMPQFFISAVMDFSPQVPVAPVILHNQWVKNDNLQYPRCLCNTHFGWLTVPNNCCNRWFYWWDTDRWFYWWDTGTGESIGRILMVSPLVEIVMSRVHRLSWCKHCLDFHDDWYLK